MEGSQKGTPNSQSVPTNVKEGTGIYENEINLIDYFRVLWKRKYFILLGSVLPALVVGLTLFFWPRNYTVTYAYSDSGLTNKKYEVLLDRFYSDENIGGIVTKLQGNGLNEYAKRIEKASRREEKLRRFIDFKILRSDVKSNVTIMATDLNKLEEIREGKALLLNMKLMGRPDSDIPEISLVIRDNFENVIPLFSIEDDLDAIIREFRAKMAHIEENRFGLQLALKKNISILAKLKNVEIETNKDDDVTLQSNVGPGSEYLPLERQIQMVKHKVIDFEEESRTNEEKYNYYKNLITLNEKLLAELNNKTSSYYTIQQFHSFLTDLVDSYKNKELKDYLNSYIKKIANRISASAPVTEKPKVYTVRRDIAKKSAIVFAISLMISIFAAFLLEGLQKSQAQAS